MTIALELPDRTDARGIQLWAGSIEEVAKKRTAKSPWEIKVKRCNSCGGCCMDVPDNWPHGKSYITGHCILLEDNLCVLKENRPVSCCIADGEGADYCNITWKTI